MNFRISVGPACLAAVLTTLFLTSFVNETRSQASGIVKLVVPLPPGSAGDTMARLLGEHISRLHGMTMVVENRAGAAEAIGAELVARAPPDGTTLLLATHSLIIGPHLKKLAYDPLTSFAPVCHLVNAPQVITVNGASPYRTLADLFDAARAQPGGLTFAAVGPASGGQIAFEKLKGMAGVNMTFVPYPGVPPAMNALLGGHVTAVFGNYAVQAEPIRAGKLRALAVATRARLEQMPDVPTVAEQGFADFEANLWFGVFAPAKTPDDLVSQFSAWFAAALEVPEIKPKLVALGLYPVGLCGAAWGASLQKRYEEFGRIIREANIKAD